jgi:hypothetical protein
MARTGLKNKIIWFFLNIQIHFKNPLPHTNHLNLYTKNKGRPILILELNFFLSYSPLLIVNLQRFGFHALTSVSLDQMILIFYTMFFLCIIHRSRSILAHYAFLRFSSYDLVLCV